MIGENKVFKLLCKMINNIKFIKNNYTYFLYSQCRAIRIRKVLKNGKLFLRCEHKRYGRLKKHFEISDIRYIDRYLLRNIDEIILVNVKCLDNWINDSIKGISLKRNVFILESLWDEFSNIAIDENDNIDCGFYIWKKGTAKNDIWLWFDEI